MYVKLERWQDEYDGSMHECLMQIKDDEDIKREIERDRLYRKARKHNAKKLIAQIEGQMAAEAWDARMLANAL